MSRTPYGQLPKGRFGVDWVIVAGARFGLGRIRPTSVVTVAELELADWRRRVSALYAAVRADDDPGRGHRTWRSGRDELFRTHPQSPLTAEDPLREGGVPYWPYDVALRFEVPLLAASEPLQLSLPSGDDGVTQLNLVGRIALPPPVDAVIDVWWLHQYGGGLFLPLRDGTAGHGSYGGGRYLLDSAKGADLGGCDDTVVIDLNFLYHPSCRYNPRWQCPLAPVGNTIKTAVRAGERLG
jgi:hypothetical protein